VSRLDGLIAAIAAEQHGLVTRHQLTDLGVGARVASRRCATGAWRRLGPGVFALSGAPATFAQRLLAAHLAAGPASLVSHRAALRLWGIELGGPVPVEVSVPRGRSPRRRTTVTHVVRDLHLAEPTRIDGVPVTGLARTLLDLGGVMPSRVRRAVWAARRTHGLEWEALLHTLVAHARPGRPGVGPLRAVLAEHIGDVATDSGTEDLAIEILLRSGRIPPPARQVPITCADGVTVTADLAWPEYRALVEIHGVDHLTNEDLQHVDVHRRNQIELAGWALLVYTGRLLRRQPDQFVRDVDALLRRGGWPGPC